MPYSWRYASLGFLLSVVTAAICWPLPDDLCFGILAIFLGAIAGVYIGIALAVADRNLIVVETVIGFLFLVLAAAGWFVSPLVLALDFSFTASGTWFTIPAISDLQARHGINRCAWLLTG